MHLLEMQILCRACFRSERHTEGGERKGTEQAAAEEQARSSRLVGSIEPA